jgi:hypothetical protein
VRHEGAGLLPDPCSAEPARQAFATARKNAPSKLGTCGSRLALSRLLRISDAGHQIAE